MQSKTDRVMCGNCEFWTGLRQPIFSQNGVPKINVIDTIGYCECPIGNFESQRRDRDKKCKNFSKWTEIV